MHRAFATRTPLDSPLSTRRLTFTPCDPVSPGLLGLGFDPLPLSSLLLDLFPLSAHLPLYLQPSLTHLMDDTGLEL